MTRAARIRAAEAAATSRAGGVLPNQHSVAQTRRWRSKRRRPAAPAREDKDCDHILVTGTHAIELARAPSRAAAGRHLRCHHASASSASGEASALHRLMDELQRSGRAHTWRPPARSRRPRHAGRGRGRVPRALLRAAAPARRPARRGRRATDDVARARAPRPRPPTPPGPRHDRLGAARAAAARPARLGEHARSRRVRRRLARVFGVRQGRDLYLRPGSPHCRRRAAPRVSSQPCVVFYSSTNAPHV